jgi:hypothetical protein
LIAGSLALQALAVSASIVIDAGPSFPGPIDLTGATNNAVSTAGTGGNTRTYTGATTVAVANLYFGLDTSGANGFSGDGLVVSGAEVYHWFGETLNTIEYRGQTTVPTAGGAPYSLFTRVLLTANSGASIVDDATTLALTGGVHSLFQLTTGTFSITRSVQLSQDGVTWNAAQPYYDGLSLKQAGGQFGNTLTTGFYWQNQAVINPTPEPATVLIVAIALFGLSLTRRRRT